jgi:hypothetical protein
VEELRAANEDFGRRVSEEARTIGERAREEAGRGANATETHTESHGASQTAHGNRTEHGPPEGRGRTTTTTTTDSNPGNGRGRGRGG